MQSCKTKRIKFGRCTIDYKLKGKGTETHGGTDRCQSSGYIFPLKMNHMMIEIMGVNISPRLLVEFVKYRDYFVW